MGNSNRYVSIGMYMPAFGFLCGALVIHALDLWYRLIGKEMDEKSRIEDKSKEKSKEEKKESNEDLEVEENIEEEIERDLTILIGNPVNVPSSLPTVIPIVLLAQVLGVIIVYLPRPVSIVGAETFGLENEDSVALGLLAFVSYTLILPRFMRRAIVVSDANWPVIKCIACLELAALGFTVALSNFSLAFIVIAIYVPFCLISRPSEGNLGFCLRSLLALAVNPFFLTMLTAAASTVTTFPDKDPLKLAVMSLDAGKRAVMYAVTDSLIFGNVNFNIAAVFLFPIWYLFWSLNFAAKSTLDENDKINEKSSIDKKND